MLVNGKKSEITYEDILEAGKSMSISTTRCKHIVADVEKAVKAWPKFAEDTGIRKETIDIIGNEINRANQ
ncbi:MAG: hypothetical protein KBS56_06510 [Clostridiales bacterium]|nr:hypothetical protein [Candidatus Crickella equi]